jgi:hypothetical protein
MKRTLTVVLVGLGLGLTMLLESAPAAAGQTAYSLAGGTNVKRTVTLYEVFHGHTSAGFTLQASVGRPLTARLRWRLDVLAIQFELTQPADFAGVLCAVNPPPGTCCGICPRDTSTRVIGLAGLAANALWGLMPEASAWSPYLIAGAETDYLYQHPSVQGALRVGGSAGAGLVLRVRRRIHVFAEVRYHALIDVPSQPPGFVPIAFGIRF